MIQIDKFLKTIGHHTDIVFTTSFGDGSDIIYIPENNNPFSIGTYFENQKLNHLFLSNCKALVASSFCLFAYCYLLTNNTF